MKSRNLILAGVILIILSFVVIRMNGTTCEISIPAKEGAKASDYSVELEKDQGRVIAELTEKEIRDGMLTMQFRSVDKGVTFFSVFLSGEEIYMDRLFVHGMGIMTVDTYFGECGGGWILPVAAMIFLLLLLWSVICSYRRGMAQTLYQYRNIRDLGWIIFLSCMVVMQIPGLMYRASLQELSGMILGSASAVTIIAFPIAFVGSILVTISNIDLMRNEGRNWRNMLGAILGILVCLGTVLPPLLSAYLQRSSIVDVHNEQGAALYIDLIVNNSILVIVAYLECILAGTIILGIKAARRIPAFNKDHILILGCQIREDGSLTPLLKGRADRALEFARMQKEATGKDIVFVPSGGQGSDEVMAEAAAVRNYLLEQGVPEERILTEDQSVNTYENFRNSLELIGEEGPEVAFATTNYHVFRSGILAEELGVHAEGIGSKTKSYFWINAFVREFIATVYSERRKHVTVIVLLILLMLAMIGVRYLSNIL